MQANFVARIGRPSAVKSVLIFSVCAVVTASIPEARAQFTFDSDNGGNYGGTWANGSNGGSGFAPWEITSGANTGVFIGSPAANGMGTSGIGTTAFGLWSTGAGYTDAIRGGFGMGVGDSLSFYWAMNWDANAGAKGIDFRVDGNAVYNINNGGSSTITAGGVNADTAYGTTPMLVTLTRTSGTQYSFSMTSRSGGSTYSTTFNQSGAINNFKIYIGNQNEGNGNRNIYFNNFAVTNSGVFNQGGSVSNANRFTGGGNLSVGNNTTLALNGSGNNDYTGTTTVNTGSTLRFEGAGTSDFASAISGGGAVVISNSAGVLNLIGNNTGFTGAITASSGILEARNANSLGTTAAGTTIGSGSTLKIFSSGAGFSLAEAINTAGVGVGSGIGAINNTGGDNILTGTITLAANTRINADTTGTSGSLTIGGNVSGGANVLFLGAQGATGGNTGGNITVNGVISGAGATQDTTTTSVYKDGAGTLTLGGANTYTGDTRIAQGNLTVSGSGNLGNGSDVFIASGASLSVNANATVASVQEWGTTNGGTITLGSGATLNVNGANKGTMYQNSISGAGGLTMAGSGDSSLSLYGTHDYTGTTTVSGGKISSGVALASSNLVISGGTFEATAANVITNTATVNMSSGAFALQGNDTIASLTMTGGTLSTTNSSTLTAANYNLNGGTVSANLGSGSLLTTSGSTTLNGSSGATSVGVSGGLLSLSAAGRLASTAAVSVSGSGELALGGNEAVASVSTAGTAKITGSSSLLTATTYALNGGTVSANLGTGTINSTSGSTTLNGTSAAATVNVSGGLLALGAADRLANSAAVSVSSGTLDTATHNDTVGSLTTTGGTVAGSGTLTAANYNLNGGTVNANLGAGTVTASSGTTSLNGSAAATTVTVNGGTLNTGGADKLANTTTVAVTSGTLGVGGNDTVGSVAISSTGTVSVATGSTLTATANSTISGTGKATGGTLAVGNNANLNLGNDAKTTTSDISIGSGSALTGTGGTTGKIGGGGLLSAGNSPGILTAGQVDVSGGLDFAFEFTGSGAPTYSLAGNSRNDLLHLTNGSNPFVGSFSTANNLSFYFNDSSLLGNLVAINPTTYLGGFYVDSLNFDIASLLSAATKNFYVADANGLISFNGVSYALMSSDVVSRVIFDNANQTSSDFATGTTSGTVLSVTMVPEPSSASLLTFALSGLLALRRRKT